MKRFTFSLTFSLTFLFAVLFMAQMAIAGPYVSLKGGVGFLETTSKHTGTGFDFISTSQNYRTGWGIDGAVGFDFGDLGLGDGVGFRAEVEGLHTENGNDKSILTKSIEVVVPCPEHQWKPICKQKKQAKAVSGGNGTNVEDFVFFNGYLDFPLLKDFEGYAGGGVSVDAAWQVIGGAIYKLTPKWGATAEFRYVVDNDDDYSNPMILFGVRREF